MLKTLEDLQAKDQRVLVRVDWNVPLSAKQAIEDDFRIKATLPTIRALLAQKPKDIFLLAHLGNPVVRPGEQLERTIQGNRHLRLAPIAEHVADLLGFPKEAVEYGLIEEAPLPGYSIGDRIVLLENLRFDAGELSNDPAFARTLAELGDVYVNEAFPEIHRQVASMVALPKLLPHYAGTQLVREIEHLTPFLDETSKPSVIVMGGAKVADKVLLIDNLLKKTDYFLLGGIMANTFLAAQGVDLKDSTIETDRISVAKDLLYRAPKKFILPIDFLWERGRALDIGPQTVALFERHIGMAKHSFWNGPMGWTSSGKDRFFHGSEGIARAMAKSDGQTVVAGGDTLDVVNRIHLASKFTFCSTGGGATMNFLAEEELPGLKVLD